jgi:TonB-linked SusC/RagA family outer membrane protein
MRIKSILLFIVLLTATSTLFSQPGKLLQGKVTEENGDPLPGATVSIVETNQGTVTNSDGLFSLEPKEGAKTLKISFIGMESKEISIGNQKMIVVSIKSSTQNVDEVVVVGYGKQRKVNLTGSVGTVSSDELKERPITNISSALAGRIPGMTVVQSSGQPGRDVGSIRIRGIGTFGDASPLVLIDGMLGDMDDVNPADIESISVLKDAASSAIYGARAANGVILVTTKKGSKNKKSTITYEAYAGWQELTNIPKYLSSAEYARLYNEARKNDGLTPTYTEEEIKLYENGSDPDNYPNTRWVDQVFSEPGMQQNHSLGYSGGNEDFQYNTSFRYFNQDGLVKGTGNEKFNLRTNLTNKLTNKLQTNVIISMSRQTVTNPVSSRPDHNSFEEIIHQAHRINPTVPNVYSDGTYGTHTDGNPLAWVNSGSGSTSVYDRSIANFEAKYDVFKGLSATGRLGIYNYTDFGKTDVKDLTYYRHGSTIVERYEGPSSVSDYNTKSLTSKLEFVLNYEKTFAKIHSIAILAGASQESNKSSNDYSYRRDIASSSLSQISAGSEDGQIARGDATSWALRSQFARLNYNFKEKYLFEANVRRDGTSRFSPDNRWGIFPSFSAGWRLSEEPFIKGIEGIENIKLRASWGQLGNQNISGLYPYISTVSLGWNYPFNEIMASGAAVSDAVSENITWETSITTNLGIDLSFWDKKLDITADYYNMKTDGLLLQLPVNPVFGLPAPLQNAAVMRNKGIEFVFSHTNQIGKFKYNAAFNIAKNTNVVEDLKGTTPQLGTYTIQEGVSYHAFYGYQSMGLFQNTDEVKNSPTQDGSPKSGDIRYKDQLTIDSNNDGVLDQADGKIDGNDRVVLGNSYPGIEYGLNLYGEYMNFDLSVFFKGSSDVLGFISSDPVYGVTSGASLNEIQLDRWYTNSEGIPQNPGATYPRLTLNNSTGNFAVSDYWIRNASYLRVKNIQVGYSLPKNMAKKLTIASARIYFSGENLFTFTTFPKGFDPETPNNAYDYYYPQVKIYSFGLIVKI